MMYYVHYIFTIPGGSKTKYRLLIYFGGRNTTGENEIKNPVWTNWCDKNRIFLIVPSYKDDNYWEPQKWSGKALLEAVAQLPGPGFGARLSRRGAYGGNYCRRRGGGRASFLLQKFKKSL